MAEANGDKNGEGPDLPYELIEAIAHNMSFEDMFRVCFASDRRLRGLSKAKAVCTKLIRTAQQRYGPIDVGDHKDSATLFYVLISLEKALKRHSYPTALPYTIENVRLLLPLVFNKGVCDKVLNPVSANTGIELVCRAIDASWEFQDRVPCTRPGFSNAVMISDSRVKVRMGVYTASGWTEIATIFIERDQKTSPVLDYAQGPQRVLRGESYHLDYNLPNKGEVLAQINAEMDAMEDDLKPPHLQKFWRNDGVLGRTLKATKRWAAEKEELSWMKEMIAFESVVRPKDDFTDATQHNARRFASYGHGPVTLFGTATHVWGSH